MGSWPATCARALIRVYQNLVSPLLRRHCRFSPSCSAYAYEAIRRFGLRQGGWLALRRLGRCHPWTPPGLDPVPDTVFRDQDPAPFTWDRR